MLHWLPLSCIRLALQCWFAAADSRSWCFVCLSCLCLLSCSHAIVSSAVGPEYYVGITSFVDKTQLEPGCSVLLHNKVCYWVCVDGSGIHMLKGTLLR